MFGVRTLAALGSSTTWCPFKLLTNFSAFQLFYRAYHKISKFGVAL